MPFHAPLDLCFWTPEANTETPSESYFWLQISRFRKVIAKPFSEVGVALMTLCTCLRLTWAQTGAKHSPQPLSRFPTMILRFWISALESVLFGVLNQNLMSELCSGVVSQCGDTFAQVPVACNIDFCRNSQIRYSQKFLKYLPSFSKYFPSDFCQETLGN